MTAEQKAVLMARLLDEKKAQDVRVLHIGTLTTIGDYFVVATGTSTTQVKALADEIDEKFSALKLEPKRMEGYLSASWILMDYQEVIAHIFLRETREFYALERLWGDAPEIEWRENQPAGGENREVSF